MTQPRREVAVGGGTGGRRRGRGGDGLGRPWRQWIWAGRLYWRLATATAGEAGAGHPTTDPRDARVDAVLGFEPLFGDLTGNAGLRERARFWHRRLREHGSLETLR